MKFCTNIVVQQPTFKVIQEQIVSPVITDDERENNPTNMNINNITNKNNEAIIEENNDINLENIDFDLIENIIGKVEPILPIKE